MADLVTLLARRLPDRVVGSLRTLGFDRVAEWYHNRPYPRYESFECGDERVTLRPDSASTSSQLNHSLETEKEVLARLLQECHSGDCVLDIGANYGLFTAFFASVVDDGAVHAVEASPTTAASLRSCLKPGKNENVTIHNVALAAENGTVEFTADTNPMSAKIAPPDYTGETVNVTAVRGDDLIQNEFFETPNVIKIDVEGTELDVINGLDKTLKNSVRIIFCEIHPEAAVSDGIDSEEEDEIRSRLQSIGFDFETLMVDESGTYGLLGRDSGFP